MRGLPVRDFVGRLKEAKSKADELMDMTKKVAEKKQKKYKQKKE